MTTTPESTETDAIAELAVKATTPHHFALLPGMVAKLVTQADSRTQDIDLEYLLPVPRRATAQVVLEDAASLITYVRKHGDGPHPDTPVESQTTRAVAAEEASTTLYASVDQLHVVAVINDHGPSAAPGWGDHIATLQLRHTDPWKRWTALDRKWLSQTDFAEHIEEGVEEIREPAAADMLDIAQTLQANNRVEFKSQHLLANGQRQFKYQETVESKAGQAGELTIPTEFKLGLIPFEGQEQPYAVNARFQFRLDGQTLKLRYLLTRVSDVVRGAFGDVTEQVEAGTGLRAFHGAR